jgi:branched-chain amino acid transport system ATP-binding protein
MNQALPIEAVRAVPHAAPVPRADVLTLSGVNASYDDNHVLHDVALAVPQGSIVALLGANGAGKSSTLRAISGQIRKVSGSIMLDGRELAGLAASEVAAAGIAHCPEGRQVFGPMTVLENILIGAFTRHDAAAVAADVERMFKLFPRLRERAGQLAGTLSGGEQQMLAIARALMARPKLVLLDEPSLGLAPIITQDLFRTLGTLNVEQGISMLIVEQNAGLALGIAQRGYVLETGSIVVSGSSAELAGNDDVRRAYLGI